MAEPNKTTKWPAPVSDEIVERQRVWLEKKRANKPRRAGLFAKILAWKKSNVV